MPDITTRHHLALLIAAPQLGDEAMSRDQAVMTQALLGRGYAADEILCLHGRLNRPLVISFLQAASRRAVGVAPGNEEAFSDWTTTEVALTVVRPAAAAVVA